MKNGPAKLKIKITISPDTQKKRFLKMISNKTVSITAIKPLLWTEEKLKLKF